MHEGVLHSFGYWVYFFLLFQATIDSLYLLYRLKLSDQIVLCIIVILRNVNCDVCSTFQRVLYVRKGKTSVAVNDTQLFLKRSDIVCKRLKHRTWLCSPLDHLVDLVLSLRNLRKKCKKYKWVHQSPRYPYSLFVIYSFIWEKL